MTTRAVVAPPASGLRLRWASLLEALGRLPQWFHLLLFRLAVASVFLKAGLTKIASWELTDT
jgi:hypothetical protein